MSKPLLKPEQQDIISNSTGFENCSDNFKSQYYKSITAKKVT